MNVPDCASSPAMLRILGILDKKANMSVADISVEAFVGVSTLACGGYIQALRKRKLIYVSGWRKVKGRFSTPLFSRGDLSDVARPQIDDRSRDAPGMDRIVAALRRYGALSYHEIARFSGLSVNTVKNSGYLNALLAQSRIHIGSWRRSINGPMLPVYCHGAGLSVAKPAALTSGEKCRRQRLRTKAATQGSGFATQIELLSAALQNRSID